ncbi:MAG: branched-chain amino acid ABC transporter permease [Clostridia bacterium]|nr:branched-chain amino acid ABC transporter permease [Clostridia bacterium]
MPKTKKKIDKGTLITLCIILGVMILTVILENTINANSLLFTVIRKGAVYSLVAVSMNLLNGFTGLFSLGQAGFMLLGAYTYAILTIPGGIRDTVYYLFQGSSFNFSFIDAFKSIFGEEGAGATISLILGVILAIICAGIVAAICAYLIGLPVLRLKSDYLAIATLGFAEILRAIFQWDKLGKVTNGANALRGYPTFADFNIKDDIGRIVFRLSSFVPLLIAGICIFVIVLLINSSYGRAFKAIRDDEIAAEAMGINLAKHKSLSFCISSFFAGVGGALFAMFASTVQAKTFTSAMTYEILLIVVIGGIGSVSGSCIASFLYIACSEWWLRFLDNTQYIGNYQIPLFRNGFRMVVFSIIIMIVVLFFRKGIMGDRELPDIFRKKKKTVKTPDVQEEPEVNKMHRRLKDYDE